MVQNVSPKILITNATAINKVVTVSVLILEDSGFTQGETLCQIVGYRPSGTIYFALNTTDDARNLYISNGGVIAPTSNCVATKANITGSVTFVSVI